MSRRKREVSLDGLVAHLDSPGDSRLYSDGRRGEREIIDGIEPPPIQKDTPMWRRYDFARRKVARNFRFDGARSAVSVLNGIIDNKSERRCTIWRMMPREMRERLLREAKEALLKQWKTSSCGRWNGADTPNFTDVTADSCFACSGS